ncbi:hypothetical protein D3C73_1353440 [compost metagenome]
MTTMESSTTRPMATVMAPSVIMFSVISICFSARTAIRSDNGMEIMEMIVERIFRKNNRMIRTANNAPNKALDSIVLTESVIGLPWSSNTVKSIWLYCFPSSSALSLTRFATSTVLASLSFTI